MPKGFVLSILLIMVGLFMSFWILLPYFKLDEETFVKDSTEISNDSNVLETYRTEENENYDEIDEVKEPEYDEEANEEFKDRCRLTFAEAGLEDEVGQIAVAATILHRQYAPEFKADGDFYKAMNNGLSSVVDGQIYIISGNDCYELSSRGERYQKLSKPFPGTIVTLGFNLSDSSFHSIVNSPFEEIQF